MALPDQDSAVGHSFGLELDDVNVPLLDVAGLVLSVFGIDHESGPKDRLSVTVVRALSSESSFAGWARQAEGQGVTAARKPATIVVFATDGTPVARYHLENAWPSKLEIGSRSSEGTTVVVEKLTLSYEGLTVL